MILPDTAADDLAVTQPERFVLALARAKAAGHANYVVAAFAGMAPALVSRFANGRAEPTATQAARLEDALRGLGVHVTTPLFDLRAMSPLLRKRRELGISQAQLALRAGIKVEDLARLEEHGGHPDRGTAEAIASVLEESIHELFPDARPDGL